MKAEHITVVLPAKTSRLFGDLDLFSTETLEASERILREVEYLRARLDRGYPAYDTMVSDITSAHPRARRIVVGDVDLTPITPAWMRH